MKFNIRTKILLTFSMVIAICVGTIAFNFYLLNSFVQKTNHIINVMDPAETAAFHLQNSFSVDIRAIEAYGSGFAELVETEKIVHAEEEKVDSDIKKIDSTDLAHREHIQSLKNLLAKDEIADEKIFDLKKGRADNISGQMVSPDLHQALISFNQISNEVQKEIEMIIDEIKEHKAEDVGKLKNFIDQGKLYIMATFSGAILMSLVLAFFTSFMLSSSVRKVRDAALKMSEGDLAQRASISSGDEIGDLAKTFNQMAENIEKSQQQIKKNEEELKKINSNLEEKLEELQKFKEITVGRELKMIELKEKLKECEETHGKKYE